MRIITAQNIGHWHGGRNAVLFLNEEEREKKYINKTIQFLFYTRVQLTIFISPRKIYKFIDQMLHEYNTFFIPFVTVTYLFLS